MELIINKNVSNCIKFFAAIMVAMHHYSQIMVAKEDGNMIYSLLSFQGGYLGVGIFFFLSGYGLMESEKRKHLNLLQFIQKRILKIYIPVLTVTLSWWIFHTLVIDNHGITPPIYYRDADCLTLRNILNGMIDFANRYHGFPLINFADGVLWFIPVILYLYCIFFLYSFVNKRNIGYAFGILVLGTICICVIVHLSMAPYCVISIPLFIVGIIASRYRIKTYKIFNYSILPLILFLFPTIIYCLFFSANIKAGIVFASHAVFNYIFILLAIIFFTYKNIDFKFPLILGTLSFDIYLVHYKLIYTAGIYDIGLNCWTFLVFLTAIASSFYLFRTNIQNLCSRIWGKSLSVLSQRIDNF